MITAGAVEDEVEVEEEVFEVGDEVRTVVRLTGGVKALAGRAKVGCAGRADVDRAEVEEGAADLEETRARWLDGALRLDDGRVLRLDREVEGAVGDAGGRVERAISYSASRRVYHQPPPAARAAAAASTLGFL